MWVLLTAIQLFSSLSYISVLMDMSTPFRDTESGSFISTTINNPDLLAQRSISNFTGTESCKICLKLFPRGWLKRHMSEVHGAIMPFTCQLCGRGYLTSAGLHYHKEMHKGKTYPCPLCESKFTQRSSLNRHMQNFHRTQEEAGQDFSLETSHS